MFLLPGCIVVVIRHIFKASSTLQHTHTHAQESIDFIFEILLPIDKVFFSLSVLGFSFVISDGLFRANFHTFFYPFNQNWIWFKSNLINLKICRVFELDKYHLFISETFPEIYINRQTDQILCVAMNPIVRTTNAIHFIFFFA